MTRKQNKTKNKSGSIFKKILIMLPIVLIIVGSCAYLYTHNLFSKVNKKEISQKDSDLGIKKVATEKAKDDIINIALFGVDTREKNDPKHSDCIVVLTIDEKHKDIKLSSVMRDTFVEVKGHDKTKITHAYAYGGPELALWTLNNNFDLNIKKYATVDFFNLEKIVDILGGVQIDVKPNEIKYINKFMGETSKILHDSVPTLTNSGVQVLNGRQAVSYARIRSTAGGDYERTLRQRAVLNAIIDKVKNKNKLEYPSLISKFLPLVETNLDSNEIMSIGKDVLISNITNVKQARFPLDSSSDGKKINGIWYLVTDIEETKNSLHDFIYNDIEPKGNHNEERN
ncbi:LCP family protein [Clostridium sp. KNHs214]|uniref:LCP family protein n=1 Tax=Clostridium sp. KNHs214 TaxID=1540257 RepID=UPI000AADBCED|nr:LCP family protein [Clostridium sp. KNHs214]